MNNKQDKLVSTDIASKVSVISGCTLMGARQYGNTVTISILVTRNIKDQTNVATISNDIKPAFVVAASVFYYNGEDMARAISSFIVGATIQYRCLTQTTGSSGVLLTFTYVI